MTYSSPEYKKAAIDWLLAHGDVQSMSSSTMTFLALLADKGVDYDASDLPVISDTLVDAGDSFSEGTYGKAFHARIVPIGMTEDWRSHETVFIRESVIQEMLLAHMITGVLSAADTGDSIWRERLATYQREREQFRARQAAKP